MSGGLTSALTTRSAGRRSGLSKEWPCAPGPQDAATRPTPGRPKGAISLPLLATTLYREPAALYRARGCGHDEHMAYGGLVKGVISLALLMMLYSEPMMASSATAPMTTSTTTMATCWGARLDLGGYTRLCMARG